MSYETIRLVLSLALAHLSGVILGLLLRHRAKPQPETPRSGVAGLGPRFTRFVASCRNGVYHLRAAGPTFQIDTWSRNLAQLLQDAVSIACRTEHATLETMQSVTLDICWAGYTCYSVCEDDTPVFYVSTPSHEADALSVEASQS